MVNHPNRSKAITRAAAKARILDIITTAKKLGARRPSDISRDVGKNGELFAVFTYTDNPRGRVEIHASTTSGIVWFYGVGGSAITLRHEEYDPRLAWEVADRATKLLAHTIKAWA